jgi:hypothetical protein
MTSCRPFRRASLPSLGDTTQALAFRSHAAERCPARVSWSWSPGGSSRESSVETAGSPTFLGNPSCTLALLFDPGGIDASGQCGAPTRPPLCPQRRLPQISFRGSITRLRHSLSTLRSPGRPGTTQDSLPAVGQTLPDGLLPAGFQQKVSGCILHPSSFPKFNVAQGHYWFVRHGLCDRIALRRTNQ